MILRTNVIAAALIVVATSALAAQQAQLPTLPGQAAYGAIAEVVRLLEADPTTNWSKVDIEGLRKHLIDMNEVTMNSTVVDKNIDGGIASDVTGTGRTTASIRRMSASHAMSLEGDSGLHASVSKIPGGARVVFTAKDPHDTKLVERIRGLGFIGLLAEGNHHARHHIALARGAGMQHSAGMQHTAGMQHPR